MEGLAAIPCMIGKIEVTLRIEVRFTDRETDECGNYLRQGAMVLRLSE